MKRVILSVLTAFALSVAALPCLSAAAFSVSDITAKSAVLIDAQSGTIITGKDEYSSMPMASTTKIMSALLLIESGDLDSEFKVDNNAIIVEGSSMGLKEDDIVTKRALCYGMLLPSGNDAANETAVLLAGSAEKFADMMNERAKSIGLKNTHFVTPSGLHDEEHYSTAYDMAILAREALKNETFREICGTKQIKLRFGNPPYERWLTNTNKLLSLYDGCIGVKTGFTDEAGRCLVSAAERNGATLICVTLNDRGDWNDHMKMYDYGFSQVKNCRAECDLSDISVNVAGGICETLPVKAENFPNYTVVGSSEPYITYETELERFIYAPAEKGRKVGTVQFYADGEPIGTSDIVTADGCEALIIERKPSLSEKIIDFIKKLL